MSQVTNLSYFYETARKVRGGRWVWVKDSNGESRRNVLLGGTILNPKTGFDHLWAGQLVQYTPGAGCLIFRSFKVAEAASASSTTILLKGDGFSDAPEVGMYLMVAPSNVATSGAYVKVTYVAFDANNEVFTVTVAAALGSALSAGAILVEADAYDDDTQDEPTRLAKVLVPNPNTFVEADADLLPTVGYGLTEVGGSYSISTVYDKQAWIERMQPLPSYVLAKNRSYIDGIFWI